MPVRSGFAIAALMLGIIVICSLGFPPIAIIVALLAIIFGILALNRIRVSGSSVSKSRSIWGIALGAVAIVMGEILLILAATALFAFGTQQSGTNAKNDLSHISIAQETANSELGVYLPVTTKEQLSAFVKINGELNSGEQISIKVSDKAGYVAVIKGYGNSGYFWKSGTGAVVTMVDKLGTFGGVTFSSGDFVSIP